MPSAARVCSWCAARDAFSMAWKRDYGGQDFSTMVVVLCETAQIEPMVAGGVAQRAR